jgi:hypothetical protein
MAAADAATFDGAPPEAADARGEGAARVAAAAAAAAAAAPPFPPELAETTFAAAPPAGAAGLVACELHRLLPPALKELSDWTAKAGAA